MVINNVLFRKEFHHILPSPGRATLSSQGRKPLEIMPIKISPALEGRQFNGESMPQSYVGLYYHLIFSTRNRLPQITSDISQRIYDYIGGIIKQNQGVLLAAGGMPDHVHLLTILSKEQSISDALRVIKTNSSNWMHQNFPDRQFTWQNGFGAFTVSASNVEKVKRYILNQEQHHRVMTFQEEFLKFLHEYDVPYDERYIWS
jgi:REP element-mobilizing transposase RayT